MAAGDVLNIMLKLCRSVVKKKTGCVDTNGKTVWRMTEVATLAWLLVGNISDDIIYRCYSCYDISRQNLEILEE